MPAPSKFTQELFDEICARLSKGEPLAQICRDEGMPIAGTVRDWCDKDERLAIAYARARDEGFDAIALDALRIVDEEPERYATELGARIDPGSVQWAKNRSEQRLKLLAKWDPKRYGDKITQEHTGANGGPIQSEVSWTANAPDDLLKQVAKLKGGV